MRIISIPSSQIVGLISFITFSISFIKENHKAPQNPDGGSFPPLSLMCCVANKGVRAQRGVQVLSVVFYVCCEDVPLLLLSCPLVMCVVCCSPLFMASIPMVVA